MKVLKARTTRWLRPVAPPDVESTRGARRRASALVIVAAVLAQLLTVLFGATPASADATALTGDESVAAPTSPIQSTGQTTSQISSQLGSVYRLVDLHEGPTAGTYTYAAVPNSGAYAVSGWKWLVHASAATVSAQLSGFRLISAERNSDGTLNVIMVANTGSAARAWWWLFGASKATIANTLTANNARLVSLDGDPSGTTYTAVMVSNTGADAKAWWWYVGQTTAQIGSLLSANGARIADLDRNSSGTSNVVMVKQAGTDNLYWKWWFGSWSTVTGIAAQTGYRIFDIQRYGTNAYATVMVDNLNLENRRVENVFESGFASAGMPEARYGYYVKQVGGSAPIALSRNVKYEPASGIKALYNLYSEFQIQIGNDSLSSPFTYWYKPSDPSNKDVCPLDYTNTSSNKVNTTLSDGLSRMMGVSDNRTTQGVDLRYGRANVNNFTHIIGMSNTLINQTVGCLNKNGGYVYTTLADLTRMYERVQNNTLLSSSRAASFFGRMNSGLGLQFASMVNAEAAALGKSAIASQFIANTTVRAKGGSYGWCTTNPAVFDYHRSDAGVLKLPFKSGGVVTPRRYAFGSWVNVDLTTCKSSTQVANADAVNNKFRVEIFRAQVRAALQTW